MENILELGGEQFKIVANFRMSYNLTKYRNKMSTGFDFSAEDKDVIAEILEASKEAEVDVSKLSDKAIELLTKKGKEDLFSDEEIIDIVKTLTKLDEGKIEELLDKEVELNGYDVITPKLIKSINLVFTNAKDISAQK